MFNVINLRKMIVMEKYAYNRFVDKYTGKLLDDYRNNIREYTYSSMDKVVSPFLKDKLVTIDCDGELYEATNGNALSIIVLLTTINKLHNRGYEIGDLNDYMFDPSLPSSFESSLDEIYSKFILYPDIKNIVFEAISQLAKISAMFVSGTMSLRDIYMLKKNNSDFAEILDFNVSENESFATMINQINVNSDKLQKFLTEKDSCFRPMILSKSGFNFKQASQIFNLIGPKPDVFGNIHNHPILTNFLNGLISVADYYVNADNCRKALITNYTAVKDSGYLTRILSMLCLDTKLSNMEQCNTHIDNIPNIFIANEFILKKYENRNMWDGDKYIKIGHDPNLIGKTLKIASPITCSCTDGICKNCYGELYKTVSTMTLSDGRNLKTNIGLVAVLLLTEVLTQSLLSTKHLLEAKTDELEWLGLDKYFEVFSNNMILKEEINMNTIKILDFDDDENIIKLSIGNNVFDSPVPLQLNSIFKLTKNDEETDSVFKIELINSEEEEDTNGIALFNFTIKNKELSDPLNKINNVINSSKIKDKDLDGNLNYMMELLNIVEFKISSEHIEVIMRELIKIEDRKDFELKNVSYEFVSAKSKVLQDSITKSLLFERLENQLLKIDTYEKENADSLLDFLL